MAKPASNVGRRVRGALVGATALFAAGPVVWMAVSSFRPADDLFSSPPSLVPSSLTLDWYVEVFTKSDVPAWFLNSLIVAILVTALNALVGLLGAYSLVRFKYPGRRLFVSVMLISYLFPAILLLVPIYLLLQTLGLVGTIPGIVAAHLSHTLPFSLVLMWSFLQSIPPDMEEAARLDGCSYFGAFVRVVIPLARTGIVATSLFAFILSWHEYLFSSVIASGQSQVLSVGIASFVTGYDVRWGAIMAMGTLVTVPILVLFGLLQRYFERGLLEGGVKG